MSDQSFFACQGLELDRWPVPQAAVLVSEAIGSTRYFLICVPDGSLGVRVVRNGATEDYETDILEPAGGFKVVISVNYKPFSPAVRVNGIEVTTAPVGSRVKNTVCLPYQELGGNWEAEKISQEVPEYATDAEAIFIRAVAELRAAAASQDWYVLLKASAPLRLILLDGLLHKANHRYEVKVEFRVSRDNEKLPLEIDREWRSVAPHGRPAEQYVLVGLDKLLKLRVFRSPSRQLTVRDVIRAAANANGGVHFGEPRSQEEKLLLEMDKESLRMGQAASRQLLKEICRVCVEAFAPLVGFIQAGPPGTD